MSMPEANKAGLSSSNAGQFRPATAYASGASRSWSNLRVKDAANFQHHDHHRAFDLVWIIYSAFFFIEPIQRNNRDYWLVFAGVYVLFVAMYVGVVYANTRRTGYLMLVCMGLLALAYYPYNGGASGIFMYVVAFAPFVSESIATCIAIFIAVCSAMVAEGMLFHMNPWSWGFPVFLSLAIGSGNLIAAQRMRANQKLRLAHEEIEQLAKVAERERIARDLHDVLGHTLSVIVLKSELAGKLLGQNPERTQKEIADVEQIARTALAEVREAIRGYRSEGLPAELDHARATLDAAGVTLECKTSPPKLRPAEETVLSLIVREAVTNIVRHAHASRCQMTFQENGKWTSLIVEDDGRGGVRQEGNGLRGMRERIESLGGKFHIESQRGTRLVIEIPEQALGER